MDSVIMAVLGAQLIFMVVGIVYFCSHLKQQRSSKNHFNADSKLELEKLKRLREIQLTEPLSEKTRPSYFNEIIGQDNGLKALKAAMCSPNPQHIIIYGPPGVGKTAAARLVLDEAKKSAMSPFKETAKFVEVDSATLHFDERSIADPLIGSVHDPIYQGAGAYGAAGIPQPKPGAVTNAHGGILFLDEIGELHPIQINKLLKVLEDRAVYLTSAYYSTEDTNIPRHIHDIFKKGLPADFRLVGATTRSPEEIPAAIRSRCTEIFFNALSAADVCKIAHNSLQKAGITASSQVVELISEYSTNGRDTVNIIQTAASMALMENRRTITVQDIEWVLEFGRYSKRPQKKAQSKAAIGVSNGLAVFGTSSGTLLEIEAVTEKSAVKGKGTLTVTGIAEEEEINGRQGKIKRISSAKCSVENVITLLKKVTGIDTSDINIHINFPGGLPIDGPSAGVSIFTAIYSSILEKEIPPYIAMTGEISIKGKVCPVGGVHAKIEAAIESGIKKILIPKENYQYSFAKFPAVIVPIESVAQLIDEVFYFDKASAPAPVILTATPKEL